MKIRFPDPRPPRLPGPDEALPGRSQAVPVPDRHFVFGRSVTGPFPEGSQLALFAMGCFWGAERMYWEISGVISTAVGYSAGHTENPTYEEVCSGRTGHTEAVRVAFEPDEVSFGELLQIFWEGHDPTQGMRQGNDLGTQYRSGIYTFSPEQMQEATDSRELFQTRLGEAGYGEITTEIRPASTFYFAEAYHQQYLAKNPGGYCGLGGTGVSCPVGLAP